MSDLETRVSILEREVENLKNDIHEIKERLGDISQKVDILVGQSSTIQTLVKWIILPLIIILGALIGVKLSLPIPAP